MRTISIRFACFLLLTASSPLIAASVEPSAVSKRMLDELVRTNGVPGMGAAIWKGDRIIWTGSSGKRDVEHRLPVNDQTLFRLASVSKLLTATAVAKLQEDGKLDVDAPVETILPYLSADWPPMTARQVAAHISGLPHYQDQDGDRGKLHYADARAAVAIFNGRPLLQAPGERYSYSSWGYTLLGALVEERSGMAFPDYVMQFVTPGLAIGTDATDSGNENAAHAYEFVNSVVRPAPAHDFSYTWGGGGFGATASAIAAFGGNMLNDRIVRADTFDWMLRPARLADGSEAGEEDYRVGFGWRTSLDEDGARTAQHNGVTVGARSALVLWRDEGVAVSLLSNALWTSSIDRTARMIAAPYRPLPNGLVATPCPVKAVRYGGSFNGQPVSGAARFAIENGLCTGTIEATGELKAWLSRGPQPGAGELGLVGLDMAAGLGRAGLVTPYGIYDWRAQPDGSFKVPFGGARELVVTLGN